jgi:hypothetical protein
VVLSRDGRLFGSQLSLTLRNSREFNCADILPKTLLQGTRLAMYIVGQERRLVNPPSQVVAGVRTVTTNMDGRDVLPRLSRPFAFAIAIF